MVQFLTQLLDALALLLSSKEVWEIALLSIIVSLTAVAISSLIGIPIGIILGLRKKPDKFLPLALLNTMMGLPPVLVGIFVFLIVARQGPLGSLKLLFTPGAMIIAQVVLTMPIIIGVTRSTIKNLPDEINDLLLQQGCSNWQQRWYILSEARSGILVAMMLALGRAFSEVGAILIVGGNIRFHTRVLTTAIITEISKGQNDSAIAFGVILLTISFALTSIMTAFQIQSNKSK